MDELKSDMTEKEAILDYFKEIRQKNPNDATTLEKYLIKHPVGFLVYF